MLKTDDCRPRAVPRHGALRSGGTEARDVGCRRSRQGANVVALLDEASDQQPSHKIRRPAFDEPGDHLTISNPIPVRKEVGVPDFDGQVDGKCGDRS